MERGRVRVGRVLEDSQARLTEWGWVGWGERSLLSHTGLGTCIMFNVAT